MKKFSSLAAPELVNITTSGAARHDNFVKKIKKFSSLAVPEVVNMTTAGAASDGNFVKMATFLEPCGWVFMRRCSQQRLCDSGPASWRKGPSPGSTWASTCRGWGEHSPGRGLGTSGGRSRILWWLVGCVGTCERPPQVRCRWPDGQKMMIMKPRKV